MKTIIIAAGRSTRMHPLPDKNLLKFCGKPLLFHLLKNLKEGGLTDFIIVANEFNQEAIAKLLETYKIPAKITVQPNLDDGMAGAVLAGLELVPEDDEVMVHNAQDFVNSKIYHKILTKALECDGVILAKKVKSYFPGGYLEMDENNKILSIVEKPGAGNEPSDLVNIVAHFFKNSRDLKSALSAVQSSKDDVYEVALQKLFSARNFYAIEYEGMWQAIKFPFHVLDMARFFLAERCGENYVADSAKISPNAIWQGTGIYIDEGVRVFDHACISGPCFIGKNSIIGNNALVRESIIGENCEIGFCSEIARSWLADNISVHHAYIGDSIIDKDVNFGAFSVTTNLRLDKKTVKIKVKDQLLDTRRQKFGCIVGEGSQIGSGAKIMPGRTLDKGTLVEPNAVYK